MNMFHNSVLCCTVCMHLLWRCWDCRCHRWPLSRILCLFNSGFPFFLLESSALRLKVMAAVKGSTGSALQTGASVAKTNTKQHQKRSNRRCFLLGWLGVVLVELGIVLCTYFILSRNNARSVRHAMSGTVARIQNFISTRLDDFDYTIR
jgi:hypothetical protein